LATGNWQHANCEHSLSRHRMWRKNCRTAVIN